VNAYFETKQLSRFGNFSMVSKTVFMLSLLLIPFAIIYSGGINHVGGLWFMFILSGFGTAGVGMGVMHDAQHGSYSRHSWINRWVGYSINLLGASHRMWQIQHNVLHHGFTNIDQKDEDIQVIPILRFSPHAPRKRIHRYQHLYSWFFYGISTLPWVTTRDFTSLHRYYKMGIVKEAKTYRKYLLGILFGKLVYYIYTLFLPVVLTDFSFWQVLVGFLMMHFVAGTVLTFVFQTAHVVQKTEFPLPDMKGDMDTDHMIHQLLTTSNFALQSRIFSWFIGGLNFQVEHHLFPKICHVHYHKIAPIIQQTAQEYGLPYLFKRNFFSAVLDHLTMLKRLGNPETQKIAV
jgi:linoleoyl-CoA desaturase